MASVLQQYNRLTLERDFALEVHTAALQLLESSQVEAQRQRKFLVRIEEPTQPDESILPNRTLSVFTVFIFSLLGYAIASMLLATIRDHVVW